MEETDAFYKKTVRDSVYPVLILFVVLPLFVVLYYAFTDGQGQFTVENFQHFFTNGKH